MVDQLDQESDTENEWDALQVAYYTNAMSTCFDLNIKNDQSVLTYQYAKLFGNLPLYASYWWDSRLGLYHVRHRVYDPNHGRWLQRDPIGYAGGNNLYGYVGNGPHITSDPMGLDPFDDFGVGGDVSRVGSGPRAPGALELGQQLLDGADLAYHFGRGAVRGAGVGVVAGAAIAGLAAVAPPVVVTAVVVGAAWYAFEQLVDLADRWGSMSSNEKAEVAGGMLGGAVGGRAGYSGGRVASGSSLGQRIITSILRILEPGKGGGGRPRGGFAALGKKPHKNSNDY